MATKILTGVVLLSLLGILSFSLDAHAVDSLSVTVSSGNFEFNMLPGTFAAQDETITASTSSIAGYHVDLGILGDTNALVNTVDGTLLFPTFTLPAGEDSIPVSALGYGYGYSTDGGNYYRPVPEAGTFTRIFETDAAGTSQHTLTYGVKPGFDTPAGTYTNTIVIRIVAKLEPCDPYNICYYGNDDDGSGTMEDQEAESNTSTTLIPSNFSKPGYGFAGWNTELDGSGTDYGPSETITTGDLSNEGLQLFAKWIPSAGTLQSFMGCGAMSVGELTALTDSRDGNTYAVARQADGQCWMIENLRLDLSKSNLVLDDTNTNNPSADFATTINTNHPASDNNFCEMTNPDAACTDQILFNTNNINRSLTASYNTNSDSVSWYSYGVYYNWYTATAGYGTYNFSVTGAATEGDICPARWRLPTGYGDSGDLALLDKALGGSGKNQATVSASRRWRAFPLNYIYSGEQRGSTGYNRDTSGSYMTSSTSNKQREMNLWLEKTAIHINSNNTLKQRGQPIRCVMKDGISAIGNIHYDNNGGAGTMVDAVDIDFATERAAYNSFTHTNAVFQYWNTKPDGTGVIVFENGLVSGAASRMALTDGDTLTLYAIWHSIYNIVYDGNGADAGTMSPTIHGNIEGRWSINLIAPNYSRTGYGFIGWSFDPDAATKLAAGNSVKIYGPNERISVNSELYSHADVDNNITLYAVWQEAEQNYTMQTFGTSQCANMIIGQVTALEDNRDNNTYAVAKLGDGNCWMIENLRLEPSQVSFSSSNTNSPMQAFISEATASSSSTRLCGNDDSACIDKVGYNSDNINRSLTPLYNNNGRGNMWYAYGVMYNWYTASAGNGTFGMTSGNALGDICPAGWRLPTGGENGEYVDLNNAINDGSLSSDINLRIYPNNFIYSGDFNQTSFGGRGTFGRFWSSTAANEGSAFRFGLTSGLVSPDAMYNKWDAFAVRCIVK